MDPRSVQPPAGPFSPVSASLPAPYFTPGAASFTDFVASTAPHLLPSAMVTNQPAHRAGDPPLLDVPHGTTIVALTSGEGVVIAGDRRATSGNLIAQRDIEKVFVTDAYSAVGIAGAAGMAVEMVRLFTVDLEHYEKIEGVPLSLEGKANKLAGMVRANLGAALQGFVVVPLFVGYDFEVADPAHAGRIVSFDPAGGRYDEKGGFHSVGSGSVFAKTVLKKLYDPAASTPVAVRAAVEALYDAADEDTATGGPDMTRGIYPVVITITAEGALRRPDEEIGEVVRAVIADRVVRPGG
jgi:proteasome beta subunit